MHLDAQPRALDDEVVDHLVEERIHLFALAEPLVIERVHLGLCVQRVGDAIRVEEEQQDRPEQFANRAQVAAVGLVEGGVFEREVRRRRTHDAVLLELLDQIRAHAARIEKLLELDVRQLLQLALGVIDAALLTNARANLPHDLFDVDRIGTNV